MDNVNPDRSPEDLLFQVMLDLGLLFSSPIASKEISGKKVFDVAGGNSKSSGLRSGLTLSTKENRGFLPQLIRSIIHIIHIAFVQTQTAEADIQISRSRQPGFLLNLPLSFRCTRVYHILVALARLFIIATHYHSHSVIGVIGQPV